ncbi:MAG: hypothetical protein ACE5MI_01280 [Acidimicrobiia bacterium]
MHNVDTSAIAASAEAAPSDPSEAELAVHLEGTWNVDASEVQFQGDIDFPEGQVTLTADFPPFLGGRGRAPTPLAYCFYGAMCCYGSTFATQAAMAGVPIEADNRARSRSRFPCRARCRAGHPAIRVSIRSRDPYLRLRRAGCRSEAPDRRAMPRYLGDGQPGALFDGGAEG